MLTSQINFVRIKSMKGIPIKSTEDKNVSGGFPIVAIGASAGGIESFTDVLKHLPENTGMAYVYIQHMNPEHESHLTEVFSRVTKMNVLEAKDKVKIKPDHIYIIPPNREMKIEDGMLLLFFRPVKPLNHSPINHFFISLAENYKEKAVHWLQELAAESNSITENFMQLSVINKSAYDSQALLELKQEYCDAKRCLQCAVGNALLKGCL